MSNFYEYRNKYPNFVYHDFKIEDLESDIKITFNFEIENLQKFNYGKQQFSI